MTKGAFWRWFIPRLIGHLLLTGAAIFIILCITGVIEWQ